MLLGGGIFLFLNPAFCLLCNRLSGSYPNVGLSQPLVIWRKIYRYESIKI